MAATPETPTVELEEYVLSSSAHSDKKKHRPSRPESDEPACDTTIHNEDGSWKRKAARQTIFQDHCQKPECFGGGQ